MKANRLVAYGIQDEMSHIRAHVCVVAQCVYFFPTKQVRDLVKRKKYRTAKAHQAGLLTSRGYLVPPSDIPRCVKVDIPNRVMKYAQFSERSNTSGKGNSAVMVVMRLLELNLIHKAIGIVEDFATQRRGSDVMVYDDYSCVHIQVKCDWNGGARTLGGSGNLFIQTHEWNPFCRY